MGIRREAPILTEANRPPAINSYVFVRPSPSHPAASLAVNSSFSITISALLVSIDPSPARRKDAGGPAVSSFPAPQAAASTAAVKGAARRYAMTLRATLDRLRCDHRLLATGRTPLLVGHPHPPSSATPTGPQRRRSRVAR